jgi:hypothetical protein
VTHAPAPSLRAEFDFRRIGRAIPLLLPLLALSIWTGNTLWLNAAVVTISTFLAIERVHLAPLGVLLHGAAILAGFCLLYIDLDSPIAFVLGCALMAVGAIALTARGAKLRSLGNFTFIPALYLALETAGTGAGNANLHMANPHMAQAIQLLPYLGAALLPSLALSLYDHLRIGPASQGSPAPRIILLRHAGDLGAQLPCREAMLAVALAVAAAAALVEWRQLDYGQWVIWSAASVVTGNAATAQIKLRQRVTGAIIGVPLGIIAGVALPHTALTGEIIAIASMLTLVSFQRYTVGFGARCACIACIFMVAGQSPAIAAERIANVTLGGMLGVLSVLGTHFIVTRATAKGHIL